jgi:hypothetical protein
MRDFLLVYEEHFDEIAARLFVQARGLPGLGQTLSQLSSIELRQRGRIARKVVRAAILDDSWEPLLSTRRSQGRMYATRGVPFSEWFQIFASFEALLIPHLVAAFAADPLRLTHALLGLNRYVQLGMGAISEAYILERESQIAAESAFSVPPSPPN